MFVFFAKTFTLAFVQNSLPNKRITVCFASYLILYFFAIWSFDYEMISSVMLIIKQCLLLGNLLYPTPFFTKMLKSFGLDPEVLPKISEVSFWEVNQFENFQNHFLLL